MAFEIANFKEAGGPQHFVVGGQLYIQHSTADALATMMASGYLDALSGTLNSGDLIILTATDGVQICRITNTAGVITVVGTGNDGTTDSLTGAGACSVLTALTLHTSDGANVVTLASGLFPGQKKAIVMLVDSTSTIVTPAATLGAWAIVTLLVVGDCVELMWTGSAWMIVGIGAGANTAGLPVIA